MYVLCNVGLVLVKSNKSFNNITAWFMHAGHSSMHTGTRERVQ